MENKRGARHFELGLTIAAAAVFALFFWIAQPVVIDASKEDSPARYEIWLEIKQQAEAAGLDPGFVFAICVAESSLNPKARAHKDYARGLMQVSRIAWKTVSDRPYAQAFNMDVNLEVGVAYLVYLKGQLERADRFDYARLAAAYRFGETDLADVEYNLHRMPKPRNRIYQALFDGHTTPVPIPQPPPTATDGAEA